MDYRDIVPLIFWPWLALSCFILARRSMNRRAEARVQGGGIQANSSPVVAESVRPADPRPVPGRAPTPDQHLDHPDMNLLTPLPPLVQDGRTIFDAPLPGPEPPAIRRTIADMVRGIELPCDLTPLVNVERRSGARETVAFVTRTFDAGTVGRDVGAELRRLGFELNPRHETEVIATRDDDWLGAAVHPDGGEVVRGDRAAFPGSGPGSVVLELWTE